MVPQFIINYIDSNICHGISLKKPSGNVGTRTCVAGIRSQQKCYALDHHNKNSVSYDVRINIGRMGKDSVA